MGFFIRKSESAYVAMVAGAILLASCKSDGDADASDGSRDQVCFDLADSAHFDARADLDDRLADVGGREPVATSRFENEAERYVEDEPTRAAAGSGARDALDQPTVAPADDDPRMGAEERADALVHGLVTATVAFDGAPGGEGQNRVVGLPRLYVASSSGARFVTDAMGRFVGRTEDGTVAARLSGLAANVHDYSSKPAIDIQPAVQGVELQLASGGAQEEVAQTTVFYFVDRAREYLLDAGFPDDLLPTVEAHVNRATPGTCGASSGVTTFMFLRAGSPIRGCQKTVEDREIVREYARFLDGALGGVTAPGLGQGWGDVLSCFSLNRSVMGSDEPAWVSGNERACDNDSQFTRTGGDPEVVGQVWAGFSWHLRELLIGRYREEGGDAVARLLVFSALLSNASSVPEAVQQVILNDDDNGDLSDGTPNIDLIQQAAERHGLAFLFEDDVNPPRVVTDLSFDGTFWDALPGDSGRRFMLRWTSAGDDGGTGQALEVRIVRSDQPISEDNFDQAQLARAIPARVQAGMRAEATVEQPSSTTFFYALKSMDNAMNSSPVSNVIRVTTP